MEKLLEEELLTEKKARMSKLYWSSPFNWFYQDRHEAKVDGPMREMKFDTLMQHVHSPCEGVTING